MTRPTMPGHLIAVLIILVGHALVMPRVLFVPLLVLALLSPILGIVLLPLIVLGSFVWYIWLVCRLATRKPWTPRWIRITAVGTCVVGLLGLAVAIASVTKQELGLGVGGVLGMGIGGYLFWAVGRADVRAWLAAPATTDTTAPPA